MKLVTTALIAARNVAVGGNLAALRLLAHPHELVNYANENLFALKARTETRGLPQKNVFDIFPAAANASIQLVNNNGESWFHIVPSFAVDIVSLCLLCRALQPRIAFEIGTLRGYTTHHLALNAPDNCRVYTLDLPSDVRPTLATTVLDETHVDIHAKHSRYCWEGSPAAQKIHTLFGDSATFDYSSFHGKVDLFFIDGAHSYEYVRSDTLNALQCCHSEGLIAWHDFGRVGVNGVSRWLRELAKERNIYSVPGGSLAFMPL